MSVDAEPAAPFASGRVVAAGGFTRAVVGFAVGAIAGAVTAAILPRDDGPRRRDLRAELPAPGEPPPS